MTDLDDLILVDGDRIGQADTEGADYTDWSRFFFGNEALISYLLQGGMKHVRSRDLVKIGTRSTSTPSKR